MTDSSHAPGSPVVEGPVPGKATTQFAPYDLSELGYVEEEYFVSGQAQAYAPLGEGRGDGRWSLSAVERSGYRTRFVVRRPLDPSRFNGTFIVEWLNVSGGTDAEPDWALMHRHIIRDGFAWVGASVQKAGIDGGGLIEGENHLKVLSPDRYNTMSHPGDAYSYDMFSQIGRILRDNVIGGPLGPLAVARLIACGHSQSAAFLVTYLNAVDPIAAVYDGYLVHGRGATVANVDGSWPRGPMADDSPASDRPTVHPALIREDVRVPVLTLQSETDVAMLGGGQARQPDRDRIRLWEVTGSAHAETYLLVASHADTGALASEELAALLDPTAGLARFPTEVPIASGPQQHYVSHAALARLEEWIRDGTPPPEAPRLESTDDGAGFVLDQNGIAVGGIRTPWVDVPTATLSGLGQEGGAGGMAFLFGTTKRFSTAKLAELYPGGLESYLTCFGDSLDAVVERGFMLEADTAENRALAAAAFPG
jgi:hypothetical protein